MAVAAEVPGRYDVVIDGKGYTFLRTLDGSYLSSNRHRAEYTYTPTFVERQNTSGSYGDNQQDFFLTESQNDWDLGEGQYFFRGANQDSTRKYFSGSAVATGIPGRATLRPKITRPTIAASILAACGRGAGLALSATVPQEHAYVSATNLYTLTAAGVQTDQGAHGAGTPGKFCLCSDGPNLYVAGTTSIRRWNGTAFSTFSATASAGSLAFLNNALYSCDGSTLKTYDSAGTATTLFTWKDATGTALPVGTNIFTYPKMAAFGGKLVIFHPLIGNCPSAWIYDGVGTSKILDLPTSMVGHDMAVLNGTVFMSAYTYEASTSAGLANRIPVVWYWANGTIGEVWRAYSGGGASNPTLAALGFPALGTVGGKLLFTDASLNLKEYDNATGAITTIGPLPSDSGNGYIMSSASGSVFIAPGGSGTSGGIYPDLVEFAQTGVLDSSVFDFDNSLTKQFRSIKVDWTGSGSVDILYATDPDVIGPAFTLVTGAVSGTEYTLPANTSGRGLFVEVRLNALLVSTQYLQSPTVKRVYVRAAPTLQSFKVRTYNLDLSSTPEHPTRLQDGSDQTLTGHEQATNLITAITSTTPITITDRFGTYTAVLEPGQCSILELHSDAGGGTPAQSGQFVATIVAREV